MDENIEARTENGETPPHLNRLPALVIIFLDKGGKSKGKTKMDSVSLQRLAGLVSLSLRSYREERFDTVLQIIEEGSRR